MPFRLQIAPSFVRRFIAGLLALAVILPMTPVAVFAQSVRPGNSDGAFVTEELKILEGVKSGLTETAASGRIEKLNQKKDGEKEWKKRRIIEKLKTKSVEDAGLDRDYEQEILAELKEEGVLATVMSEDGREVQINPDLQRGFGRDVIETEETPYLAEIGTSSQQGFKIAENANNAGQIFSAKENEQIVDDITPDVREEIAYFNHAANDVQAVYEGNKLIYPDLWDAVDMLLTTTDEGMKEDIILKNNTAQTEFNYIVETVGLQLQTTDDGGFEFVDDEGQTKFYTPAPDLTDSTGTTITSGIRYLIGWGQKLDKDEEVAVTTPRPAEKAEVLGKIDEPEVSEAEEEFFAPEGVADEPSEEPSEEAEAEEDIDPELAEIQNLLNEQAAEEEAIEESVEADAPLTIEEDAAATPTEEVSTEPVEDSVDAPGAATEEPVVEPTASTEEDVATAGGVIEEEVVPTEEAPTEEAAPAETPIEDVAPSDSSNEPAVVETPTEPAAEEPAPAAEEAPTEEIPAEETTSFLDWLHDAFVKIPTAWAQDGTTEDLVDVPTDIPALVEAPAEPVAAELPAEELIPTEGPLEEVVAESTPEENIAEEPILKEETGVTSPDEVAPVEEVATELPSEEESPTEEIVDELISSENDLTDPTVATEEDLVDGELTEAEEAFFAPEGSEEGVADSIEELDQETDDSELVIKEAVEAEAPEELIEEEILEEELDEVVDTGEGVEPEVPEPVIEIEEEEEIILTPEEQRTAFEESGRVFEKVEQADGSILRRYKLRLMIDAKTLEPEREDNGSISLRAQQEYAAKMAENTLEMNDGTVLHFPLDLDPSTFVKLVSRGHRTFAPDFSAGTVAGQYSQTNGEGSLVNNTDFADFDFTTGTLDSRITFTRANTATYTDAAGTIQTAAADTPRFDYDPVTKEAKGLLIEEARTNLATYSEQFDNAAWTKYAVSTSNNIAIAPDGTTTMEKAIEDTTANHHYLQQATLSAVSGTTYTATVFAKAAERSWLKMQFAQVAFDGVTDYAYFDLTNGTVGTVGSGATATIENYGNGIYRVSISTTAAATGTGAINLLMSQTDGGVTNYTGDGVSGLYLWGAQLEAGSFPTSYIPTTTAAVTRAADLATITDLSTIGYNAAESTLFTESSFIGTDASNSFIAAFTDTTGVNNISQLRSGSTLYSMVVDATVSNSFISSGVVAVDSQLKLASSYKLNNAASSKNGATVGEDITTTVPSVSVLNIGSRNSGIETMNGHISRISYWPERLPNEQLEYITANGVTHEQVTATTSSFTAVDASGSSFAGNATSSSQDWMAIGDSLRTNTVGAKASFTTGTATEIWAGLTYSPAGGVIRATIDAGTADEVVTTIDTYSATLQAEQKTLLATGLKNVAHTVELELLAEASPKAAQNSTADSDTDTKLLIHSDTTNGSTSFADSSASGHAVTAVGNVNHSTAQQEFGSTAMYFDGTGDYLSTPSSADFNFGSENLTIDAWVNVTTHPDINQFDALISQRGISDGWGVYIQESGGTYYLVFTWYNGSLWQSVNKALGASISAGWHHFAAVRDGDIFSVFWDGVQSSALVPGVTILDSAASMCVGYDCWGNYNFTGYLDEVRITKGKALWTSDFAVPTLPGGDKSLSLDYLETYSAGNELNLVSTIGTADSGTVTTLVDAALTSATTDFYKGYALTFTSGDNNGETVYVTAFDPATDTLTFTPAVSTAVATETYQLTPDGMLINSRPTRGLKIDANSAPQGIDFEISGNLPTELDGSAKQGSFSIWTKPDFAATADANQHFVFDSGLQRLYYDGADDKWHFAIYDGSNWVKKVSSAVQSFAAGDTIHLAASWNYKTGLKLFVNGAKTTRADSWTAQNIAQANETMKLGAQQGELGNDADTVLLLQSDTTDGSTTFTDSSLSSHGITANGDAQHVTAAQQLGSSAISFDGTGDYLSIPDGNEWNFGTEDFTIDLWVNINAHDGAGVSSFLGQGDSPSGTFWDFRYYNGNMEFYSTESNVNIVYMQAAWAPALSTWYHVAISREGSSFKMFVDGEQIGTTYTDADATLNSTDVLNIGRAAGGSGYRYLNGYMDEIRITKGTARWTANFTPPARSYGKGGSNHFTGTLAEPQLFDYVLTDSEVYDIYNSTVASTSQAVTQLVTAQNETNKGLLFNAPLVNTPSDRVGSLAGSAKLGTTATGTLTDASSFTSAGTGKVIVPDSTDYEIAKSALFDGSTGYLSRTPTVAGNRQVLSVSFWMQKSSVLNGSGSDGLLTVNPSGTGSAHAQIYNATNDEFAAGTGAVNHIYSSDRLRDTSNFDHIFVVYDVTASTASNRLRAYKNNKLLTKDGTQSDPTLNTDLPWNDIVEHRLGYGKPGGSGYFYGYMADVNFIDGQALTPADFGQTDPTTGKWMPKAYTGTYGTNGFKLDFSNAANLGADSSGNGNDWTVNGGVTQTTSTPTENYATLNSLNKGSNTTLSNGNRGAQSASSYSRVTGTTAITKGKWYWEVDVPQIGDQAMYGIGISKVVYSQGAASYLGSDADGLGASFKSSGGDFRVWYNGSLIENPLFVGAPIINEDIYLAAVDMDSRKLWLGWHDVSVNTVYWLNGSANDWTGDPSAGTGHTWDIPASWDSVLPAFSVYPGYAFSNVTFDENDWAYAAPTGFSALSTANLPAVTDNVDNHWKTVTYTGTGATQSITGLGYQPDFVWHKSRSNTWDNEIWDSVRGATKYIETNTTNAEATDPTGITSFDADGFTLGTSTASNNNGDTYVAWTANLPNQKTSGWSGSPTITPTMEKYNAELGMSIVKWNSSGGASVQTIPHSLGKKPGMIIVKSLDNVFNWWVYSKDLGATKYVLLNSTAAAVTSSTIWNDTEPTADTITLGTSLDSAAGDMIAYVFAESDFVKIGSYTGNGSADGPMVNEGIEPAFFLHRADASANWNIWDSARNPHNPVTATLLADQASAEENTYNRLDFVANGFKGRDGTVHPSSFTGTNLYLMIGEPVGSKVQKVQRATATTAAATTEIVASFVTGPDRGIARVTVDADTSREIVTEIDTYAASDGTGRFLVATGLDPAAHTVTIEATGTQNSAATSNYVEPKNIESLTSSSIASGSLTVNGRYIDDVITQDYATLPNAIQFPDKGNISESAHEGTIEAWVKTSWAGDDGAYHFILDTRDTSPRNGCVLYKWNNNALAFQCDNDSGSSTPLNYTIDATTWPANTEHHLVAKWWRPTDSTFGMALYLNGKKVAENKTQSFVPSGHSLLNVGVTSNAISETYDFDGEIYDLAIYSHAFGDGGMPVGYSAAETSEVWQAYQSRAEKTEKITSQTFGATTVNAIDGSNTSFALERGGVQQRVSASGNTGNDEMTTLLIQSDTTNGSTTFTDASSSAHTITANGNTNHSTAQQKFGSSAMYFDGTGDYLSIADHDDFDLGTSDFTVDFWVNFNSVSGTNTLIDIGQYDTGVMMRLGGGQLDAWIAGSNYNSGSFTLSANQWYHLSIVRNGSDVLLFVNGSQVGSGTNSANIQTTLGVLIGDPIHTAGDNLNAYLDEVRITKGKARWTENFIPPASSYAAPYTTATLANSVKAYVDGVETSISSVKAGTFARVNNASGLGNTELTLTVDSIGDTNEIASTGFLHLGNPSGQRQREKVYYSAWNGTDTFTLATRGLGDTTPTAWADNTIIEVAGGVTLATAPAEGSTVYFDYEYAGDVLDRSRGDTSNEDAILFLDKNENANTGWQAGETLDNETKLLIQSDTIGGSTTFTDASLSGHGITPTGNAKHSIDQKKFGSSSMYFDGTGDYLSVPASADWNFDSDFTIDTWVYLNGWNYNIAKSVSNEDWNSAVTNDWDFNIDANGYARFYRKGGASIGGSTIINKGQWTHVAVVRSNGVIKVYTNGQESVSSMTDATALGNTQSLQIGRNEVNLDLSFNGYMDELRIIKGKARWTADFTPPAAPTNTPAVATEEKSQTAITMLRGTQLATVFEAASNNSGTTQFIIDEGTAHERQVLIDPSSTNIKQLTKELSGSLDNELHSVRLVAGAGGDLGQIFASVKGFHKNGFQPVLKQDSSISISEKGPVVDLVPEEIPVDPAAVTAGTELAVDGNKVNDVAFVDTGDLSENNTTASTTASIPFTTAGNYSIEDSAAAEIASGTATLKDSQGSGYQIDNAALFDGSTGYLSRTPASESNTKTFTLSTWVKRASTGTQHVLLSSRLSTGYANFQFRGDNDKFEFVDGNYGYGQRVAHAFRDPAEWDHIVYWVDTTAASAADRSGIYINGVAGTNYETGGTALSQDTITEINRVWEHNIGRFGYLNTGFLNGYLAEFNFVDGQKLAASDFGEFDATTGKWLPKTYVGTYGTNGFKLDFSNAANLGADSSGNGNDWTVNGTVTQVTDTPTNTYATLNPLIAGTTATLTNGNTSMTAGTVATHKSSGATLRLPSSGKFGWRVNPAKNVNNEIIGVANLNNNPQLPATGTEIGTGTRGDYGYRSDGNKYNNGNQGAYGATWTSANYIQVGCDADAGTIEFFKDGVSQGVAFTGVDFTQILVPANSQAETTNTVYDFTDAPTGFSALSTANLPAVTDSVDNHWKTVTYSGTSATQSITGLGYQPDFAWIKNRTSARSNLVLDSIRGAGWSLAVDQAGVNVDDTANFTSFDSDGFSLAGSTNDYNRTGENYVAWTANLPNTKTSGWAGSPTITPTMEKYNSELGMSIVSYTGNGTAGATIPHSLGVKPGVIMIKSRSGTNRSWQVYHSSVGATGRLELNDTGAVTTSSAYWNDTEPTNTLITLGNAGDLNGSGETMIAYIFAESDFVKIGSYTGNGSADGPMINEGIEPVFELHKKTNTTDNWIIQDKARSPYSPTGGKYLFPNLSNAESVSGDVFDWLANGLKIRTTTSSANTSAGTYTYLMIGQPVGTPGGYSTTIQTVTTNDNSQISTATWSDLDSVTVTETLNSQSIYYATSFDARSTWKIWDSSDSSWRSVARDNSGTWQYNSAASGSTTWTDCATNDQESCLSQAFATAVNQMSGTAMAAISDSNWNATGGWTAGATIDLATGLSTSSAGSAPTVDGVTFNATANPLGLSANISSTAGTFAIAARDTTALGYLTNSGVLQIGSEKIRYDGIAKDATARAATLFGVERGYAGTTAASHSAADAVSFTAGDWTHDDTTSWYHVAAGGGFLGIGSEDGSFPERAKLIATDAGLSILDAADDSIWMSFDRGAGNAITSAVTAVTFADGAVYAGTESGVVKFDFKNDAIKKIVGQEIYTAESATGGTVDFADVNSGTFRFTDTANLNNTQLVAGFDFDNFKDGKLAYTTAKGVKTVMAESGIKASASFDGAGKLDLALQTGVSTNASVSFWVKRDQLGINQGIISGWQIDTKTYKFPIRFTANDTLYIADYRNDFGYYNAWETTYKFRDTTDWYHILLVNDTAQNDLHLYVNGVSVALPELVHEGTYHYASYFSAIGGAFQNTHIGYDYDTSTYMSGKFSDFNFVEAIKIPTDFGETDATTGKWVPKSYSGSYGNNGFKLDFSNAANLGADSSGNGNDWTVNGTVTQVTSMPTDTYATLNPLYMGGGTYGALTFANGNNTIHDPTYSGNYRMAASTLSFDESDILKVEVSFEKLSTNFTSLLGAFEVNDSALSLPSSGGSASVYGYRHDGNIYGNGSLLSATGVTYTGGDRITMLWNGPAGTLEWRKNDVTVYTATSVSAGNRVFGMQLADSCRATWHFSENEWSYSNDVSYKALSTANLPAVTDSVENHWKTVTYTGNGSTQSITGVGFQPDFVWIKDRSAANSHVIQDSVRGNFVLYPDSTSAEGVTGGGWVKSFDADGFTIDLNGPINTSANNYVAWTANLPNTKTSGWTGSPTITPTMEKYNSTLGMSIVKYTGNGTAGATIPHSLGAKPGLIIVKSTTGAFDWLVYNEDVGATKGLYLNSTSAAVSAAGFWNNTEPTSSVFSAGTDGRVNSASHEYIAYIFAESDFVKIGSYAGNGSVDGPMINEGIEPTWFMTKRVDSTSHWTTLDETRLGYNPAKSILNPNDAAAEWSSASGGVDFVSTGAKLRDNGNSFNTSGGTYTYLMIGQPVGNASSAANPILPSFTTDGPSGKAATFSGAGEHVALGANPDLTFGTSDFSVNFWMNTISSSATFQNIIGNREIDNANSWWLGTTSGKIHFNDGPSTGTCGVVESAAGEITANKWYQITLTRSGTDLKIYKNGVLIASGTDSCDINSTTEKLEIGLDSAWGEHFFGSLDQISIQKGRALTLTEIRDLYNAGLTSLRAGHTTALDATASHVAIGTEDISAAADSRVYTVETTTETTARLDTAGAAISDTHFADSSTLTYAAGTEIDKVTAKTSQTNDFATNGYEIDSAALFDGSTGYLSQTPSAGTATKWTMSLWVQRLKPGTTERVFGAYSNGSNFFEVVFQGADDTMDWYDYQGGAYTARFKTTQKFRDPTAWHHFTYVWDSGNAVAADRQILYLNGERITAFDVETHSASAGNVNTAITHYLGAAYSGWGSLLHGGMSQVRFIDGQALSPSSFGEVDATTGTWVPKEYDGAHNDTVINASSGTIIGDAPSLNALSDSFDGTTNEAATTATTWPTNVGIGYAYIGKDWGADTTKTVTGFRVYSSNDQGFKNMSNPTIFVTLEGSNDNFSSDIHNLGSTQITDSNGAVIEMLKDIDTSTAYRYHRLKIDSSGGADGYYIYTAEVQFLEAGMSTATYGTNGFKLDFSNPAALGADRSGNGNDWTVNGGVTQVTSTPTETYATWNPVANTGLTLSNGNKTATTNANSQSAMGTLGVSSGKWYFEVDVDTFVAGGGTNIGLAHGAFSSDAYNDDDQLALNTYNGNAIGDNWSPNSAYGSAFVSGDKLMLAFDVDNNKAWFGKNGAWFASGDPAAGSNDINTVVAGALDLPATPIVPFIQRGGSYNETYTLVANPADWIYNAPTGFKALSTKNLPAVTDSVENHWKTVTYAGTGATQSITGLGYQPDFVWIKNRTGVAASHNWYDSVRGATKVLNSSFTSAELTLTNGLTSFDADGFTLGSQTDSNNSGDTYVAWTANLPNTKTSGWTGSPTITPTMEKYNSTLGMSIVKYTGNGTGGATIPHSLGTKPGMIITKRLDSASVWYTYHSSQGATKYGQLHLTEQFWTNSTVWNDTEPTSSLITFGNNSNINASGGNYIAYIFAESDFVKIGSYTGNGSADGPMVNEGIEPAFFLHRADASANWNIWDSARNPHNPVTATLLADQANAEENTYNRLDFVANGFKGRDGAVHPSSFTGTNLYLMIGEPVGKPAMATEISADTSGYASQINALASDGTNLYVGTNAGVEKLTLSNLARAAAGTFLAQTDGLNNILTGASRAIAALAYNSTRQELAIGTKTGNGATLDLDLTAAPLDSRVNFTRASTATYTDASGALRTTAVNTPRFDHDPVTLAAKGLLIEEARTNDYIQSQTLSTTGLENLTIAETTGLAPDGTNTAVRLQENTVVSEHRTWMSVPLGSTTYTVSGFVKLGASTARRYIGVYNEGGWPPNAAVLFDLQTGTYQASSGAGYISSSIQAYPNSWYRISMTFTSLAAAGGVRFHMNSSGSVYNSNYVGDNTSSFYLWGAQLEAGSFPTSYIPTTTATATRAADVAVIADLSTIGFDEAAGTIFSEFDAINPARTVSQTISQFDDGTSSNIIQQYVYSGIAPTNITNAGVIQVNAGYVGTISANTSYRLASTWANNDAIMATDGTLSSAYSSVSVPTMNTLRLGKDAGAGNILNGHISHLSYWPERLPNASLQAITTTGSMAQQVAGSLSIIESLDTTPTLKLDEAAQTSTVSGLTNDQITSLAWADRDATTQKLLVGTEQGANIIVFTIARPTDPSNLVIYKSDALTIISNGSSTDETSIVLKPTVTHPTASTRLTVFANVTSDTPTSNMAPTTSNADGLGNPACASGTSYSSCASKIWFTQSAIGDYSSTPYQPTITIPGLTELGAYKLQITVSDSLPVAHLPEDAMPQPTYVALLSTAAAPKPRSELKNRLIS